MNSILIRGIFIASTSLAIFGSNPVMAQSENIYISANGAEQTVLFEMPNGTTAVVDNISETIFITTESGQNFEVSFQQAVNQAVSGTAERAAMMAQLKAALGDPGHTATFTTSTVPRLATSAPPVGDGGGDQFPRAAYCPSSERSSMIDGASGGMDDWLGGPCDLGPCTPYRGINGRIFYMQDAHSGGIGQGSVSQQTYWANDFNSWQHHRAGRCQDMRDMAALMTATTAGTIGGCAAALSLVGAFVCGGGLAGLVIESHMLERAGKDCAASYPGPGNWG